jgi:hypothetical protein
MSLLLISSLSCFLIQLSTHFILFILEEMTKFKNNKEVELEELKNILVSIYSFLITSCNYFKNKFEISGLYFQTIHISF